MTQTTPETARSGIDIADLDPQVRPQDDLFRHVNGRWLATHVIPDDRAMDGGFRKLYDEAEVHVREIIADAAAASAAAAHTKPESASDGEKPSIQAKIGALFESFMDVERIKELGISPLSPDLAAIAGATTSDKLTEVLGALQRTGGAGAVGFWVDNDALDPERYVVYLAQSGLGLPDEAYYREDQYAPLREKYVPHISRMLTIAGVAGIVPGVDPDAAAQRVLDLETKIAACHWDVVKDRDADLTYNPMPLAKLIESAPGFGWNAWVTALGAPQGSLDDVVVREPDFATGFAGLWESEPLEDWKAWMVYHLISARAPYLTDDVVEANFDFYGRTLSGTPQVRERWKRGVALVEGALGEAVGQEYVARHFPPTHKARMDELVANLVAAYRESISALDWMGAQTKARALAKLEAFTPKIGYPVKWRDYSNLDIEAADLVGNVCRSNAFDQDRELNKIGKPLDRDEWFMTPQTVNAYYNPGMNEIVFPAAILQPPFFDAEADDAVNYGAIGAVIGHEIGHGFDDQGSKYDGTGRLEDWWTPDDRTEFERRTAALIEQYNAYRPQQLPDDAPHVNGALTIGENIGDLGGLSIAIKAYRIALGRPLTEAPVLDGLTGLERVFLGWAQAWQSKGRDEEVIRRIATDPHSPDEFRCNGVVRNIDEFYETYGVTDADALYLEPGKRVRIW